MGAVANLPTSAQYRAAREALGHRLRAAAILDVEGPDREGFLQGQLTQEVRRLASGEARSAAALTPRGKLLFFGRLVGLPDRLRLLLPSASRETALAHLSKYAAFQKVTVADRSDDILRFGLYGPAGNELQPRLPEALLLPGESEFSAELLIPRARLAELESALSSSGSIPVGEEVAEILRVEAGRPRFGRDADQTNLADEAGLQQAISTTKGCFVGQEIVARLRTYGRLNRRLVGYRFSGEIPAGATLRRPEAPAGEHERTEAGRVTSAVLSPSFGPIGLGFAFHDVPVGGRLVSAADPGRAAIVTELPFA